MKTSDSTNGYDAVILAGGEARRMQDSVTEGLKTLLPYRGATILEHITDVLQQQSPAPDIVGLSIHPRQHKTVIDWLASRPALGILRKYLILDGIDLGNNTGFSTQPSARIGPMAGILAGLEWASSQRKKQNHNDICTRWLLTISGDTVDLPDDLINRLWAETRNDQLQWIAAAGTSGLQPPIALWRLDTLASVRTSVQSGERKIDQIALQFRHKILHWPKCDFHNINTQSQFDQL